MRGSRAPLLLLVPGRSQLVIRAMERFRDDARLCGCGHEIRIACPARHDVNMDVLDDTCTGSFADVDSDIEIICPICPAQHRERCACKMHQFGERVRLEIFDGRLVFVGNHHHMAIGIGVAIEDHESALAPVQDKVFWPILHGQPVAEHAARFIFLAFDIDHSPRSPNTLHLVVQEF